MTLVTTPPLERLACPECHATLARAGGALQCERCQEVFRRRDGLIDFTDLENAPEGLLERLLRSETGARAYERAIRPAISHIVGSDYEHEVHKLVEGLAPRDGRTYLDLACGTGTVARAIASRMERGTVLGIDRSRRMLARAMRNAPSGRVTLAFVRADASALPLAPRAFDGACCAAALHLFDDPLRALEQVARVLVPEAPLVLTTLRVEGGGMLGLDVASAARGLGARPFKEPELAGLLRQAGFVGFETHAMGASLVVRVRRGL